MEDNVALNGYWLAPSPSPRTYFSAMLGEDARARPVMECGSNNQTDQLFRRPQEERFWEESNSEKKSNLGGGLGERIAATAGFNAPRLNTQSITTSHLSLDSDVKWPYFTVPPGLSPTTLLDPPVFLSNSLVQQSPTTGKLPFLTNGNIMGSSLMSDGNDRSKDNRFDGINMAMAPTTLPQQNFPGIEVSVESESSLQSNCAEPSKRSTKDHGGFASGNNTTLSPDERFFDGVDEGKEHCPRLDDDRREEDGEQRDSGNCLAPSDDGYNWRKYGQKPVKGSEYPRSYYKCTHPNCQVKKKVERSREGHIAEIIYKGAHNHPKSSCSNRRNPQADVNEQQQSGENDLFFASQQKGSAAGAPDPRHDNLEETSSASVGPRYINQSTSLQLQNGSRTEHGDAVDASSTFSDEEDEEDRGTHGSKSLGYDGEGDESESKRRKIEVFATESSGASRAIREPRVVVQTTSEVDLLDDGYRWRKYGQKVVKGNPNPRSYYKCTSAGCTVRKHVERASHDLKSVITTYEGKHNHAVPARRNSSHMNAGTSSATSAQATPTVQNQSLRQESSQDHNKMAKFDQPQAIGPPVHWSCHGMNHPTLPNLAVPVLGPGQAKIQIPVLPINPYIMHHRQTNEMGFVLPKGELKGEPMSDAVYHRIMSRLPLGAHL